MIAELFYTKEFKEVIADLRAQDDLNEDALERFDQFVGSAFLIIVSVHLVLSLIVFHPDAGVGVFFVILICFSLVIWGLFDGVQESINKFLHLYNYGHFKEGICSEYGRGYYAASFIMVVNYDFDGKSKTSKVSAQDQPWRARKYKKGDKVLVAYDPLYPNQNVPFVESMAKIFYLRKELPDVTS